MPTIPFDDDPDVSRHFHAIGQNGLDLALALGKASGSPQEASVNLIGALSGACCALLMKVFKKRDAIEAMLRLANMIRNFAEHANQHLGDKSVRATPDELAAMPLPSSRKKEIDMDDGFAKFQAGFKP